MPAERDMACTFQYAARVPRGRALEKIIARLAIGKGIDVNHNQPLDRIDNKGVVIDRMERLFLIGGAHQVAFVAFGGDWLIGRQCHTGCVAARHMGIVAQR